MACSLNGDDARQQANDLVYELRKRYKLAAYVYAKKFDFGDEDLARSNQLTPGPRRKYAAGSGVRRDCRDGRRLRAHRRFQPPRRRSTS